MKNTIIIQIEEKNKNDFHTDISLSGNKQILAKAIAGMLRNDERFRDIIMEAIYNLICGVHIATEKRSHEQEPVKGD